MIDAPSRDHTYLVHMLAAIERIRRYVGRKGRATFLRNALLQDAVIRNIEIVGEAAGRVSTETTSRTPEVPWREIVGMRHRLIHGYLEVNLNTVWQVVARDLPALAEDDADHRQCTEDRAAGEKGQQDDDQRRLPPCDVPVLGSYLRLRVGHLLDTGNNFQETPP